MATVGEGREESVRALAVTIDGTRYCLDLSRVANVVSVGRARDPAATPLSPAATDARFVAGTLDLGDRTVRVLDVRELFGGDSLVDERDDGLALSSGAVVVFGTTTDGHLDGWLVDDVGGTGSFDREDVRTVETTARHVEGTVDLDGDDAVWLDPVAINR